MAEWFKATVLKTVIPKGIVSSNLTPSADTAQCSRFMLLTNGLIL